MAALENAKHRVRLSVLGNRIIANSMEPRGAQAEWLDGHLHMAFNGQGVWQLKADLMKHFNLPAQNVRVTIPDVGGGFGMKSFYYPEHLALAAGARLVGRPLAWMSERTEAMLSDNAGRDLVAIDRWFPSSKRCSCCGHIVESLPLNIRRWQCPECGTAHDRDTNAAVNIKAAGHAVLALGENVSLVSSVGISSSL